MITDDEKIRKAYEIYYKRNGIKYRNDNEKEDNHFFRNFLILLILVTSLLILKNRTSLSKFNFKKEMEKILNTKIDLNSLILKDENNTEKSSKIKEKTIETQSELKEKIQDVKKEETAIWPYNGEITSEFGYRNSENEKLKGNHTGIDIAGEFGTDIIASLSGKVTKVSEDQYLGNYLEIENDQYTTTYAHCSEIYVKEGEEIEQGKTIAAIGSTGNSTRKSSAF